MKPDKSKWLFNSFCSNTLVTEVSEITETQMGPTVCHISISLTHRSYSPVWQCIYFSFGALCSIFSLIVNWILVLTILSPQQIIKLLTINVLLKINNKNMTDVLCLIWQHLKCCITRWFERPSKTVKKWRSLTGRYLFLESSCVLLVLPIQKR